MITWWRARRAVALRAAAFRRAAASPRAGVPRRAAALLAVAALPLVAACGGPAGGAGSRASGYRVICADAAGDAGRLQRAIDASPPRAVIEISGTCLLTRGVTLLAGRTYTGDGRTSTVLRQDGPMGYVVASDTFARGAATTGAPLTIEQLTVACSGRGRTDGIVVLNWQVEVQQVDVSGCGGAGIVDSGQAADGKTITNTSVNSRFSGNFISGSGTYGFEVADSGNSVTDGYLVDNQIASSGQAAIELQNAAGWHISGNHLYNNVRDGIIAGRMFGTTISGNYIEDFGSRRPAGTWYGIAGSVQDGNGSTIFGNSVFNDLGERGRAVHVYIAILKVNAGTGQVAVTGNIIGGAGRSDVALSFAAGGHALTVAVTGNVVTGTGTVTRHSGAVRFAAGG